MSTINYPSNITSFFYYNTYALSTKISFLENSSSPLLKIFKKIDAFSTLPSQTLFQKMAKTPHFYYPILFLTALSSRLTLFAVASLVAVITLPIWATVGFIYLCYKKGTLPSQETRHATSFSSEAATVSTIPVGQREPIHHTVIEEQNGVELETNRASASSAPPAPQREDFYPEPFERIEESIPSSSEKSISLPSLPCAESSQREETPREKFVRTFSTTLGNELSQFLAHSFFPSNLVSFNHDAETHRFTLTYPSANSARISRVGPRGSRHIVNGSLALTRVVTGMVYTETRTISFDRGTLTAQKGNLPGQAYFEEISVTTDARISLRGTYSLSLFGREIRRSLHRQLLFEVFRDCFVGLQWNA